MEAMTPPTLTLTPEEISDLPLFNEVQIEIKRFQLGQGSLEAVDDRFQALEELLGRLFGHLHEQLQFQVQTEQLASSAEVLYGGFAVLQTELPLLRRAIHNDDEELVLDHLNFCRETLGQVTATLAELKHEEESQPAFCDIPLLNDTCRVSLLVAQSKLASELMRLRLDQSWDMWEQLCEVVNTQLGGQGGEDALTPLGQALAQVEHGLTLLEEVLIGVPHPAMEPLEEALDLLGTGSTALVGHYKQLKEPPQVEESLTCFRCSQDNPPGSARCSRCNAVFPTTGPESTLSLDETGSAREFPTHVARLVNEVEAFRARRSTPQNVLDAIKDLQTRMQTGLAQVGNIEVLDEDAPAEQHERLSSFYNRLSSNIEKALQALRHMSASALQGDPIGVDRCLAELLEPVELLLDLQRQLAGLLAAQE